MSKKTGYLTINISKNGTETYLMVVKNRSKKCNFFLRVRQSNPTFYCILPESISICDYSIQRELLILFTEGIIYVSSQTEQSAFNPIYIVIPLFATSNTGGNPNLIPLPSPPMSLQKKIVKGAVSRDFLSFFIS